MGMHYSHFLIPTDFDVAPTAIQVAAFFKALHDLRALPLGPTLQLRKHTGKSITGRNGFTGETLVVPIRTNFPITTVEDIPQILTSELDYDLVFTGDGPDPLAPFPIYEASRLTRWTGPYYLQLGCLLRPSTNPVPGLDPLDPKPADAEFHRLGRSKLLSSEKERPRFWITFELGKWLLPEAHGEVFIDRLILRAASNAFATSFTEGWTFN